MKGIVFTEFIEMVEAAHGADLTDELLDLPGLTNDGAYTSVGTYEFWELASMVAKLSELLEVPPGELLLGYGQHMFKRFVALFPDMFEGQCDALQFLAGVHDRIHVEVRKLYPEAELPFFDCVEEGGGLTMTYKSARPLASLAEGLIRGCLEHFGEDREVSHESTGDRDGTEAVFSIR